MGNRFMVMLVALAVAFLAGWLFANEVRPPSLDDLNFAVWVVAGFTAVMSALLVAVGR